MWILRKIIPSVTSLVCLIIPHVGLGDAGPLLRMVEQILARNADLNCPAQSRELQGAAGSTAPPLQGAGARGCCLRSLGGCEQADLQRAALLGSSAPAAPFIPPCTHFVIFTYRFNTVIVEQAFSMLI